MLFRSQGRAAVRKQLLALRRTCRGAALRRVIAEMLRSLDRPVPRTYLKCALLRRHWGCPGHHIVFRRPLESETLG